MSTLTHQNNQLRDKLNRICAEASDLPPAPPSMGMGATDSLMRGAMAPSGLVMSPGFSTLNNQTMSFASSSEFFDAREYGMDDTDDDASSTSSDVDLEDLENDKVRHT